MAAVEALAAGRVELLWTVSIPHNHLNVLQSTARHARPNHTHGHEAFHTAAHLSGVAVSSSFHILIVLSASHVTRRVPVTSNEVA